ncbi:MAG: thymidine phosphorylase [Fusobacteriota bacterium]
MRAVDIIQKKRDKKELTDEEIKFLLDKYMEEEIPDYQMSSFLMATYFNDMTKEELNMFTDRMMHSGDLIKFEGINKFLVDKHSTGGVGDKTTIALAPILAYFDIGTAKLSGRGLGHTGGTIDKFESIKGFTFPETREELIEKVNKVGIGLMGYSDKIVPLDKKLYSLRDVTATVPSIPLIASSIMSKKLAVYADGIILDVKVGSGAFMKNKKDATELADRMLEIGKGFNRKVIAVLTNMDQPLGHAVGNSLELIEAIETLKGNGPNDFSELVLTLGAVALLLKEEVDSLEEGKKKIQNILGTEKLLQKLKDFIEDCGGDPKLVDDYSILPVSDKVYEIKSKKSGNIKKIEAEEVGKAAMVLGAGRAKKSDKIDHSVGIVCDKKIGDNIKKGEVLGKIYYKTNENLNSAKEKFINAFTFSDSEVKKDKIILEIKKGF